MFCNKLLLIFAVVIVSSKCSEIETDIEVTFIISGADEFGGNSEHVFSKIIVDVVDRFAGQLIGEKEAARQDSLQELPAGNHTVTLATVFGHTASGKVGTFTEITSLSSSRKRIRNELLTYLNSVEKVLLGESAGIDGVLKYCVDGVFSNKSPMQAAKVAVLLVHSDTLIAEVKRMLGGKNKAAAEQTMIFFVVFPFLSETCKQAKRFMSLLQPLKLLSGVYCGMDLDDVDIAADVEKELPDYRSAHQRRLDLAKRARMSVGDVGGGWETDGEGSVDDEWPTFECAAFYCRWYVVLGVLFVISSLICSVPLMVKNAIEFKRRPSYETRTLRLLHQRRPATISTQVDLPSGSYFLAALKTDATERAADDMLHLDSPLSSLSASNLMANSASETTSEFGARLKRMLESGGANSSHSSNVSTPNVDRAPKVASSSKALAPQPTPALTSMMEAAMAVNPMLAAEHRKAVAVAQRKRRARVEQRQRLQRVSAPPASGRRSTLASIARLDSNDRNVADASTSKPKMLKTSLSSKNFGIARPPPPPERDPRRPSKVSQSSRNGDELPSDSPPQPPPATSRQKRSVVALPSTSDATDKQKPTPKNKSDAAGDATDKQTTVRKEQTPSGVADDRRRSVSAKRSMETTDKPAERKTGTRVSPPNNISLDRPVSLSKPYQAQSVKKGRSTSVTKEKLK